MMAVRVFFGAPDDDHEGTRRCTSAAPAEQTQVDVLGRCHHVELPFGWLGCCCHGASSSILIGAAIEIVRASTRFANDSRSIESGKTIWTPTCVLTCGASLQPSCDLL